jgi:L-aspartate oxidase
MPLLDQGIPSSSPELATVEALRRRVEQLRQLCWQVVGVERQGGAMGEALRLVRCQRQACEHDPLWQRVTHQSPEVCFQLQGSQVEVLPLLHELRQRLVLAELLMEAALFREESRGGHFRTDMPLSQPFWRRHSVQEIGKPIHTAVVGEQGGSALR